MPLRTRFEERSDPGIALLELLCLPVSYDQTYSAADSLLEHSRLRWGDLIELAVDHKMLCLLADYLSCGNLARRQEPRRARFLERQLRLNQHTLHHHRADAARITRTLNEAGIPFVATAGIALESTLYQGRGERPISDIDLMIEATHQPTAGEALASLGYRPSRKGQQPSHTYVRTSTDPLIPRIVVDLTHQIADPGDSPQRLLADVIDRRTTQPIPGHHHPLAVPTRADHAILATLAFRTRSRQPRRLTLLSCADLLRLWHHATHGGDLDIARQAITRYSIQTSIAGTTSRLDATFGTAITTALDLGAFIEPGLALAGPKLSVLLYGSAR